MRKVVSVVFAEGGKLYHFDPGELDLQAGEAVIVSTARGTDFGRVVRGVEEIDDAQVRGGLKHVQRRATDDDLRRVAENAAIEREALVACRELVAEAGLAMKPVAAETTFEGSKVFVSFVAEERVDFRKLVGRLSERLQRRVELRQVSARDEARLVGGYGQCGRPLCCTLYAGDQEPVSIRMAKDQSLPLNPSKISGCCGRLMCCLKYEHRAYVDFKKRAPRKGTVVSTPDGRGTVVELVAAADSVAVDLGEGRVLTCKLADLQAAEEAE